ncbi:hypothetical protein [Clostridium kluyveri]|uniref:Uncharacterized protein n=1 Tax=Clostridium kluyveri (strain ATCC 8527 / DSM 555 / NBRC 12016 / NCIMB 10680 / K1) TaxID=431943 RepID=A5N2D3_CLOK5|nr:hypothetical protein [Clostridium kluyveri]EDK35279.1 Hypothetical protein CKL_3276 [Clostridium kluyveri DSM 555]
MKNYIIWLKSGETIRGIANESTLRTLECDFLYTRNKIRIFNRDRIHSFRDNEGAVFLNLNRIEAIFISK